MVEFSGKNTPMFQQLLEVLQEGTWYIDTESRVGDLDEKMCELLGLVREDAIGRPVIDFLDAANRKIFERQDIIRAQAPVRSFEISLLNADGANIPCTCFSGPIVDEQGECSGAIGAWRKITDADKALEDSEARLKDTIDAISDGFALYDAEERMIICNDKYIELFPTLSKVPGLLVPGMSFEEFVRAGVDRNLVAVAEGRSEEYIAERVQRFRHPKGPVEHVQKRGRWIRSEERTTSSGGTVCVRVDVTERVLAVKAMKESEQRFRDFAESSSDWFWEMDENLRFTYFSGRYGEITNFDPEERIGTHRMDFVSEEELSENAEKWDAHQADLDARRPFKNFEFASNATTFDAHHVSVSGVPVFDETGEFKGYRGIGTDITARKSAEVELRNSDEKFRALIDNSPAAIVVKDLDGKIVVANRQWNDWFAQESEASLGKTTFDLFPPELAEDITAQDRIVLENLVPVERNRELLFPDGKTRHVLSQKFPILGGDERPIGIGSIITDVTDQRNLEEQARRSQRMEAVGQLTGGVAHDFNNLLAVMIGNSEMLEDRIGEDKRAAAHLLSMKRAIDRAASLTDRLLAFSRQQNLASKSITINGLVLGLEEMFQRSLGETIELQTNLGPGTCDAMIDPHQFENALLNLAINARDAMPAGGVLTIDTANVTLDEAYAEQQEEVTPGEYIRVAVGDSGVGMSPNTAAKVFEPFFTTKGVGDGSGLGLSMVYGFVKQSGGHITIDSEIGVGTMVNLYLPASSHIAEEECIAVGAASLARGSERILLVEDDHGVREVSDAILRKQGYSVTKVEDGKGAMKHLLDDPPFDLLLTDLVLPGGMNGVEIANQAMHFQPDIKVLFTTGYAENADIDQSKMGSDVNLINKPHRRAELLEKVRTLLDRD